MCFDPVPAVSFESVSKRFGSKTVVQNVSFSLLPGKMLALIGRSGCGKTTTLRLANGLEVPSSGRICLAGKEVTAVDALRMRREIGYVIQEGGLFPHLNIFDNVSLLGLVDRTPMEERRPIVWRLLDMLRLPHADYATRYPSQLSGGERQRVSIARALYRDPRIILMDEPFGALDPITRGQLQDEFLRIKKELGKAILMVTHDVVEAFALADVVGIMDQGSILQLDTPERMFANPASDFVEQFVTSHLKSPWRKDDSR
jgi:osmoprotectant transport system ATP-binding protein